MEPSGRSAERLVTLIVPTVHRRAALFARALRYLSSGGFQCPIVVSDHSPSEHVGVIADIAQQYGNLDLRLLQHPPDIHFLTRLTLCAKAAETPYVHLHADDDFVVRATLALLIQEMEARPDRSAAMGINVHIIFATRDVMMIPKAAIELVKPFNRLLAQLETYSSVLYALRRRDEFIASLSFAVERCPDVQFWQYLESCMSALAGPIAVIEQLHYVREDHSGKWSSTLVRERSSDHFPYLILSPELHPRVAAFRAALIAACEAKGITADASKLDGGLIHLLFRAFGAMGMPKKRIATEDQTQAVASRLWARLADTSDPTAIELRRIFTLGPIDNRDSKKTLER